MRARPGTKVTPQEEGATPQASVPADQERMKGAGVARCASRISSSTVRSSPAVLSIVFVILGAVAYARLPVAQYPEIAPPIINVTGQYPGASAEVVASTVVAPIEEQINGVENMLYVGSNSTADGRFTISVTFDLGTNLDIAQVQVQNRVAIAQPRLPADVRNIGVTVTKSSPDLMMVVHLYSPDKSRDTLFISNYATLEIKDVLTRIDGVGSITVFGSRDYAMRIWLDPHRLHSLGLTAGDVTLALQGQNVQVAGGVLNQPPVDRARRLPGRGQDAGPPRQSGRVRQYRGQADADGGRAPQGRGQGRARGARLFVEFLSRPRSRGRTRGIPASRIECAVDRARRSARPWSSFPAVPSRHQAHHHLRPDPVHSAIGRGGARRRSARPSSWSCWWSFCSCRPGARRSFRSSPFRSRSIGTFFFMALFGFTSEQSLAVRARARGRHRGRRRHRRGRERRAQYRGRPGAARGRHQEHGRGRRGADRDRAGALRGVRAGGLHHRNLRPVLPAIRAHHRRRDHHLPDRVADACRRRCARCCSSRASIDAAAGVGAPAARLLRALQPRLRCAWRTAMAG